MPKIDQSPTSNLRKGIVKLREEKRPFINIKLGVWLTPSEKYQVVVREQKSTIEQLWKELEAAATKERADDANFVFPSWQWYKERRESFYELKRHHFYENFLSCTCPIGITDVPCKHAVLKMEDLKLIKPKSTPLQKPRKRGRTSQVGRALENS